MMVESHTQQMTTGSIYLITNTINNKQYVGQTKDTVKARWAQHKKNARKFIRATSIGEVKCKNVFYLHKAMAKHGIDNFKHETIKENVLFSDLDDEEITFITKLNTLRPNGYNIHEGGGHHVHSDATKALMSKIAKENAPKLIDKYRREETKGLPMNIVAHHKGNSHGFAICNHTLCSYKSFTINSGKYATMDDCKAAAIEFLANLQASGVPYAQERKSDPTLPIGVTPMSNGYLAQRKINGVLYRQPFNGKVLTMEQKRQAAIDYIAALPTNN